jgi:hypothetical protein
MPLPATRSLYLSDLIVLLGATAVGLAVLRFFAGDLEEMKGLQSLGLFDTGIGDAALVALREVPQIRRLAVKSPAFTADGVAGFGRTNPGTEIVWSRCAVLPDPFVDELNRRRIRRQGWTGRMRLAWKALIVGG